MKSIFRIVALLSLLSGLAFATATVSGTIKDPSGAVVPNSFVRFEVTNTNNGQCSVAGSALGKRTVDFTADSVTGAVSGTLYRNDTEVSCAGSFNSRYNMTIYRKGVPDGPSKCVNVVTDFNIATPNYCVTAPPVANAAQYVTAAGNNVFLATNTFTDARFNGSPWVDVRTFGAVGDWNGSTGTDNTTAIQKAADTGKNLYFPPGRYMISGRIRLHEFAQSIKGENPLLSSIVQTSTTADAIFIDVSSTSHPELSLTAGAQLFNVIDGLEIEGPGASLTTGYGIDASGNGTSHSGDYLVIRNTRVKGFARGLYFKGWGMVQTEAVISQLNGYGAYVDAGSSNSYNLRGLNTNQNTTVGIYWTGGLGNTILLGDQGTQARHIEVAGGQVTFIGGNMESYTGADAVHIDSNATATFSGQYINQLAGSQTTVPFTVDANATLILEGVRKAGFVNGTPMAQKNADSAIIRGITDVAGAGDTGVHLMSNGGETYRITPDDSRLDNGVPAATADRRGDCIHVNARTVSAQADKYVCYYRDGSGNPVTKDLLAAFQGGQQFQGWCLGVASANTTLSLFLMGQSSGSSTCTTAPNDSGRLIMVQGGTIDNLRVIAGAAGVNASSGALTVYVNNIATAVTCTVGTGTGCSDLTHSTTVSAGDQVSVRYTTQVGETLGSIRAAFLLH